MRDCQELMPGIDCGEGDRLFAPASATREQIDAVLRYLVAYRYRVNDRMDAFRLAMRLRRFMRTGERFPQEEGAL
jgi:hypothetical protein